MASSAMLTSGTLTKLLREKHSGDVFVAQCKNGASGTDVSIFDAWAMAPSWAHPRTIGYEIKVSRSDFLRDNKWRAYLPGCNEFYFVCPAGLIDKTELPEEAGLYWVTENGSRLYIKKKAPYRDNVKLEDIYKYILMYRSGFLTVVKERSREERLYEFQRVLEDKKVFDELGRLVSDSLRQKIRSKIFAVERENKELIEENKRLESAKTVLQALGVSSWQSRESLERDIKNRLNRIATGFTDQFLGDLARTKLGIERIIAQVEASE